MQGDTQKLLSVKHIDNKNKVFIVANSFCDELRLTTQRFLLIALQLICQFGVIVIGTVMVGQLPNSAVVLSGVGLAKTFVNVTGMAMAWGITTSLFTLIPQAIGAGHMNHAALHTQRAFYLTTIVAVLLSILQFFAGDLLILLGQPPELKALINTFCRLLIPYIFLTAYCAILQRLSQTLDYNKALTYCALLMLVSSFPLNWLFMYGINLGYMGAAIGQSLSFVILFISIFCMLIYKGHYNLFVPLPFFKIWTKNGIVEYIKLAIPGLFQNAFEFIIEEIAIIFAGYIVNPSIALSTSAILSNIFLINMAICLANCNATNLRVGKYIGKGHANNAKRAAKCGILIAIIMAIIYCILFYFGRHFIPRIYTNNPYTIQLTERVLWIFVVFMTGGVFLQTLGGIYRGLGFQRMSAVIVFISYWIISFPISVVLLFVYPKFIDNLFYGTAVIWGSLAFGNVLAGIVTFFVILCYVNWNKAINESKSRIKYTIKNYQST